MMRILPLLLLVVLLYLISSYGASAFRPFVTEDTDVSEKGEIGLELGNEFSIKNNAEENVTTLSIVYGLTSWIETEIDFALLHLNPDLSSSEFGLGDTVLLAKLKLTGEGGVFEDALDNSYMPEIIIEPSILIPTGNEKRGLGSEDVELGILLGLAKHLSFSSVRANIGYFATNDPVTDETFDDRFFYGFQIDFPFFRDDILIGTEITGAYGTSDNDKPLFWRAGLVYEPHELIAIDGGLEIGLNDAESSTTIILGITLALSPFFS